MIAELLAVSPSLLPAPSRARALLFALGHIAYALLEASSYAHARVVFALQAMLFAAAAAEGCIAVRHPSLYALPLADIWRCFVEPRTACVYVIASPHLGAEYIGSTGCWRSRLYSHARHILLPGLKGQQFVHTYARPFRCDYAFVPVSLTGGCYLEDRLIRTFSPALNVHSKPGLRCAPPLSAHLLAARRCHRQRRRAARGPGPDLGIASYSCGGVRYPLLFDALCAAAEAGGSALVFASPASQWLDSTKVLLRCFGSCLVTCLPLSLVDAPLERAWPLLKARARQGRFIFSVERASKAHPFVLARTTLLELLADRSSVRRLYYMPQTALITLMRAAHHFTPVRSRHALCALVNGVHKARFQHTLLCTPLVRVPWGLHAFSAPAARSARLLLGELGLPRPLASYLQQRTRVVCARGRTIAQLLHGHIRLAQSASLSELLSAVDDGLVVRLEDLAALHPALRPLACHSGVCPVGAPGRAVALLCAQLRGLCAPYAAALPAPATARLDAFAVAASAAARTAILGQQRAYAAAGVPPLAWWLRMRRAFDACGLVCLPLDRDPHRTAVCSKAHYLSRLRALFLGDTTHYAPCPGASPASVVAQWRADYVRNGWQAFGPFDSRGTVGYAYCFPKAKNITRSRVIVSCVRHPMRRLLHAVGRALMHLLAHCAFPSYNLASVGAFTQRLHAYAATLGPDEMLLALCTDVKEMYTGMDHAATLDSVQFMLAHCTLRMRACSVSVAPGWRGDVYGGDSRAQGVTVFPLSSLLPFVQWELSNLVFTLGPGVLRRQVVGAAMGGFTSPACAQCVAAVAEYRCMRAFIDGGLLFGARYMDDTLTLINLTRARCEPGAVAAILRNSLRMYTPAGLEVEIEAVGVRATMLCSTVLATSPLTCTFWNKNAAPGPQRVRRFLPAFARAPSARRSLFAGTLCRVAAATFPACVPGLAPTLLQLRFEFRALGYPAPAFDRAVRAFAHARCYSPDCAVWRALLASYTQMVRAATFRPP